MKRQLWVVEEKLRYGWRAAIVKFTRDSARMAITPKRYRDVPERIIRYVPSERKRLGL